ncbi:MAG: hypothetical protein F6K47_09265 [Symploca sp. SIO2E6]|nr:hypothetical protein [Symploca sp. SIO2E6]
MSKIVCGNCSYVLNLSTIPNPYEFDSFKSQEVDDFLNEVMQKVLHYPDVQTKLAVFSDLWAEKSHGFLRCPNCGSIILTHKDGSIETYAKI